MCVVTGISYYTLFSLLNIYPAPQHVDPSGPGLKPLAGRVGAYRTGVIQDPASELRRILLLRRWVNKGAEIGVHTKLSFS
jgi:hypothetical protein